jgi:hypothetical protein
MCIFRHIVCAIKLVGTQEIKPESKLLKGQVAVWAVLLFAKIPFEVFFFAVLFCFFFSFVAWPVFVTVVVQFLASTR